MNGGVFVLAEHEGGDLRPITLELLSEGKKLAKKIGANVACILIGHKVKHLCAVLGHYGADTVLLAEDERLCGFSVWVHVLLLEKLINLHEPQILLFGSTPIGREVAPAIAARRGVGLVTDCNILEIDGDELVMTKFIYGGQASASIILPVARPQMATILPGLVDLEEPDDSKEAEVIEVDTKIPKEDFPDTRIVGFVKGDPKLVDITEAVVIVAGGGGIIDAEHFKAIEDLAEVIGGSVAGSRVAVDRGWIPYARQVGLSGKITKPELFIACAISGALQFQLGMKDSRNTVAINIDRNAAIFDISDVKVLGDVHQVLHKLSKKLRERES